jgi:hypothetical protein
MDTYDRTLLPLRDEYRTVYCPSYGWGSGGHPSCELGELDCGCRRGKTGDFSYQGFEWEGGRDDITDCSGWTRALPVMSLQLRRQ